MSHYKYFNLDEIKCKCGECDSDGSEMSSQFMKKMDFLRESYGSPLHVTSAYRCPEYNAKISSTGKSGPHTTGRAIDIWIARENADKLVRLSYDFGFTGRGINQKGDSRFVHLDDLSHADGYLRPTIWSY